MNLLLNSTCFFLLVYGCQNALSAEIIKCPKESILVDYTSSSTGERNVVCQKKEEGNYIKHGLSIIYNIDGSIKSRSYFENSKETAEPHDIVNPKSDDLTKKKESSKKILDLVFENLLNIAPNKEIVIVRDYDLCQNPPMQRLGFIKDSIPYDNSIIFAPKCFFQGTIKNVFDQKVTAEFQVKDISDFKTMTVTYFMKRKTIGDKISISVDIYDGQLVGGALGPMKFSSESIIRINLNKLMGSMGRNGVELEKLKVDVSEFEGKALQYTYTL